MAVLLNMQFMGHVLAGTPTLVSASRSAALLHGQVAAKDAALGQVQARLGALQEDHARSLAQLEERGAQLAARSDALEAAAAELEATRALVAQMQGALGEAEQGEPRDLACAAH